MYKINLIIDYEMIINTKS